MKYAFLILGFFPSLLFAQQTLNETLMHDGENREYIVYVPASYDANNPAPIVFNFHGFTMTASDQMLAADMRPVADTAGFILVYPQGTLLWGNPHWKVGSWTASSTADDLGFTEAMLDTLITQYNIDQNRVFACGFSNGGYFSYELACKISNRFAAVASVGGTMSTETFTACNPQHPTPVLSIHGTSDGTVNYNGNNPPNSRSQVQVSGYWNGINNTMVDPEIDSLPDLNPGDGSTVERHIYRNTGSCAEHHHYKVNGGDHTWPGSWGNMDISASALIWDFFAGYDMSDFDGCQIAASISESDPMELITLYPNPATSEVTITFNKPSAETFKLYGSNGQLVMNGTLQPGENKLNIEQLETGMYYMQTKVNTFQIVKVK